MSRRDSTKQHEVQLIAGIEAVTAYHGGETSKRELSKLGRIKDYKFDTLPEMNAFIYGIEETECGPHILVVDDLQE